MNDGNRPNFPVNKPHSNRVQVLFTDEQLAAVDAWMVENRYRTRNDAIRELIARGLGK